MVQSGRDVGGLCSFVAAVQQKYDEAADHRVIDAVSPQSTLSSQTPSPTGLQSPKFPACRRANLAATLARVRVSFRPAIHSPTTSLPDAVT